LVGLINAKRDGSASEPLLDKDKATIRCLAHVLHLAVSELLKALKSLPEDKELEIGSNSLSEEEAERLHAERTVSGDSDLEGAADAACAILKVRRVFSLYS
jgi:hypothetical protein